MATSNACWGIEVGAGAVKAIKLERDGDGAKVTDFVVVPHRKVLSTPGIDQIDAIRVAMGAFLSQYRDALKGTPVAVSVPGHSSFARFAKLPPVEPKGVPGLVKFEAVQQIPFPIEEVEWDYQTFANDDSPEIEVGIFAITKEKVAELLALYKEIGLPSDIITLSPVAAYNAIAYDLGFTESTPGTIILDIGTTSTDLIVAEQGRVWIRTFPLGGHRFTEAIAESYKLDYRKAEALKREVETSKYRKAIFQQALKPVLSELVQDVQRSISYYEETHPNAKITRLIGLGSTFRMVGLRKLLQQQLQLEVHRMEGFRQVSVDGAGAADFEAASLNLTTAYGLALQGLGMTPIRANLVPVSVVREAMWKRKTPVLVTAAMLGLAAAGVAFVRPIMDRAALDAAESNSSIDAAVREASSDGNRRTSEWNAVKDEPQPGYTAENIRRLFEQRNVYDAVLADVSTMFADAQEKAGTIGGDLLPDDAMAFELRSLDIDYVAPGTALPSLTSGEGVREQPQQQANDRRGRGRGRGGRGGGAEPAAGGANVASPKGALHVVITADTRHPDNRAFLNDTLLSWLRSNQVREGMALQYAPPPGPEEVPMVKLTPEEAADVDAVDRSPAGRMGQNNRAGASMGNARGRDGQGGMQQGAAGGAGAASQVTPLDQLAPLPMDFQPTLLDEPVYRFTLRVNVQLEGEGAPAGDGSGNEGGRR
ncbi:MAG: type IV pilus assembly protein PilM [Planctomycetota bacterium]